MRRIFLVLNSGGDFTLRHVVAIRDQLKAHMVGPYTLELLTDKPCNHMGVCDYLHVLKKGLPGWWAKMELFQFVGTEEDPILFMDIDTVIRGDLSPCFDAIHDRSFLMATDFYFPKRLNSTVMGWNCDMSHIYEQFAEDMAANMARHRKRSDQTYIEEVFPLAARWQNVLPKDFMLSYKADIRGKALPERNALICFHGKPRPWDCGEEWTRSLYL